MKIINEAYAVLSDPIRRRQHDEWIAAQEIEAGIAEAVRASSSAHTQPEPSQSIEEFALTAKRRVAFGYFAFGIALLIFGLSAWFSPIGGEGWTGRGMFGIPESAIQIFERFIGFPFGLWITIWIAQAVFSGVLLTVSADGLRFSDPTGKMFRWSEISRCEDTGKHIVFGGMRNGKKWERRIIRSMIDGDVESQVAHIQHIMQS